MTAAQLKPFFPITPPPFPSIAARREITKPLNNYFSYRLVSSAPLLPRTYSSCQRDTRSCPARSHLSHTPPLTAHGDSCPELLLPRLEKSLFIYFALTCYAKMGHVADLRSVCEFSVINFVFRHFQQGYWILGINLLPGRCWQHIYTQVWFNFL